MPRSTFQFDTTGRICAQSNQLTSGATARVTCTRGGRWCNSELLPLPTPDSSGYCPQSIDLNTEDASVCFNPWWVSGQEACRNWNNSPTFGALEFEWINVANVTLNSPLCTPSGSSAGALVAGTSTEAYGVAPSSLGLVTFPGGSANLSTKGGFIVMQTCPPGDESCSNVLGELGLALADFSVGGVPIKNGSVRLVSPVELQPAEPGFVIPKGAMLAGLAGEVPGGVMRVLLSPSTDVTVVVYSNGEVEVSGSWSTLVQTSGNTQAKLDIDLTIAGSKTNPQAQCAGQSAQQMLFGFEDPEPWKSSQANLSLSEGRHTQGCFGLAVAGSGYMVVTGATFASPVAGATNKLGLDVFIPTGQPNPYWLGAVQLYASCPSGNLNNAYVGQVELTGKPVGAFSTLVYSISPYIGQVLAQPHTDCFFSIAVNVNPTPTPVVLDNLRFVP